jgi:CCR4-NOT transcription complex subunit 7/8
LNINSLKLIQLGITLRNTKGEYPSKFPYYTWQFNFKFNLEKDINSAKSIKLLKKAGIDFSKLLKNGIEHKEFASYLITSGLVLNPDIHWICFQGSYDFGYLLRLLINEPLPEKENEFIELLNIYFPNYYDIRMLAKDKCCLQGSLNKLAKRIKIDRGTGISHQAGSDSYITIEIFYKLIKCGIVTKELMKKNKNILYGIGLGQDNDMIIKYMKNEKNEKQSKKENYYSEENNNYLEFENNNNMINNYFFYSNIKAFNYSLINMNCYSINYFYSNIFYYNDIKNLPKIIID